jgi:hypothetical protein
MSLCDGRRVDGHARAGVGPAAPFGGKGHMSAMTGRGAPERGILAPRYALSSDSNRPCFVAPGSKPASNQTDGQDRSVIRQQAQVSAVPGGAGMRFALRSAKP